MSRASFVGQHPGESVLFVFSQHIIAMRKGFYGLLLSFCLPSIPFVLWSDNVILLSLPMAGLLIGLIIMFHYWIGWHFSVYIVTDERIRQQVQRGLFHKTVIDLSLNKVQNISYNIPGLTGSLFNFGTIVLQTMVGNMIIDKVPHCEKIYGYLSDAVKQAGGKIDQADQGDE